MPKPPTAEPPRRFVLRPRPPLRALAIAAGAATVGAGLLVAATAWSWPAAVPVLAAVLLVFGVALAGTALVLTRRLVAVVETDRTGFVLRQGGRRAAYAWSAVRRITLRGARMVFQTRTAEADPTLTAPRGPDDPAFEALAAEVTSRMNADRGYRG